ncbi:MAG TPA: methionyl-tRNA formyltransferase [Desulfonatronum sp.]|nr:methionyl-tRNA formyltransferase [Desulfonatronum sp.]
MDENKTDPLRLIFFGTPFFATQILDALHQASSVQVVAVVTQPDRPCGRGRACKPSAVKVFAQSKGYPVFEPETLKTDDIIDRLFSFHADVFVVAAYGLLLPSPVLEIPPRGCLNVHASLLPKYRGASPIQAALLNDERVTGITIIRMVEELDAGPILMQRAMGIDIVDTAQSLSDQLSELGGRLIVESLHGLKSGSLTCIEQNHAMATYAPKLTKGQGRINWNRPAQVVHNHIRAMHPWPGAFFTLALSIKQSKNIVVHPGEIGKQLPQDSTPGSLLGMRSGKLAIACQDREYLVGKLHPSDGKIMSAQAFYCGYQRHLDNIHCSPETLL